MWLLYNADMNQCLDRFLVHQILHFVRSITSPELYLPHTPSRMQNTAAADIQWKLALLESDQRRKLRDLKADLTFEHELQLAEMKYEHRAQIADLKWEYKRRLDS